MKKLPEVYKNEINKIINNNKDKCLVTKEDRLIKKDKINEISLDDIFNGIGYSYNIPITIKTKNKEYNTSLIAKTNNNVITIDNDIIPINEIITLTKRT